MSQEEPSLEEQLQLIEQQKAEAIQHYQEMMTLFNNPGLSEEQRIDLGSSIQALEGVIIQTHQVGEQLKQFLQLKSAQAEPDFPEEYIVTSGEKTMLGLVKSNGQWFSPTELRLYSGKGHLLCLAKMVSRGVINIAIIAHLGPPEELKAKIRHVIDNLFLLNEFDIGGKTLLISIDQVTNGTDNTPYALYHQDNVVYFPLFQEERFQPLQELLRSFDAMSKYTFLEMFLDDGQESVGTTMQYPTAAAADARSVHGQQLSGSLVIRPKYSGQSTLILANDECSHSKPYSNISCIRGIPREIGNQILAEQAGHERNIERNYNI